jgi:sec-independent protein translocase protein TatA
MEAAERTAAMAGLTGWHLVILIGVMVLLFGARRLPDMARAVGQSARIFKHEIKHDAGADQSDQRSIADRTHRPTP